MTVCYTPVMYADTAPCPVSVTLADAAARDGDGRRSVTAVRAVTARAAAGLERCSTCGPGAGSRLMEMWACHTAETGWLS